MRSEFYETVKLTYNVSRGCKDACKFKISCIVQTRYRLNICLRVLYFLSMQGLKMTKLWFRCYCESDIVSFVRVVYTEYIKFDIGGILYGIQS